MIFKFKKGTHRAWPWYWLRWWPLLINPKKITRTVTFLHESKYWLPGIDQQDHNKLFGIGFLHPKKNSARFGWRYDPDEGKFVISAFVHVNGKMDFKDLCSVDVNTPTILSITITGSYYIFKSFNSRVGTAEYMCSKGHNKKVGLLLGPYFGGNRPSPQTLRIELKK